MHGVICQGMQRALEISLIDLTKKGGFFAKQDHIADRGSGGSKHSLGGF